MDKQPKPQETKNTHKSLDKAKLEIEALDLELKPLYEKRNLLNEEIEILRKEQGVDSQIFMVNVKRNADSGNRSREEALLSSTKVKVEIDEIKNEFQDFLKKDGIFFKKEEIDLKINALEEKRKVRNKDDDEMSFVEKKKTTLNYLKNNLEKFSKLNDSYHEVYNSLKNKWDEIIQPGLDAGMTREMAVVVYRKDENGNYFNSSLVNDLAKIINETENLLLELEIEEERINEVEYDNYFHKSALDDIILLQRKIENEYYNDRIELVNKAISNIKNT